MKIECMEDDCEEKQEYPTRASATKDGWRWDEFQVDGQLFRYGYCEDHKEDNSIPNFQEDYDPESREDIEEMKQKFTRVQNVGRSQNQTSVMDSAGGKSQSLDQF